MLRKEQKTAIIDANRTHPTDTGSPEVQIAILTERINVLKLFGNDIKYYVNPTGKFVIGGPHGDTGLTGRKIIVDTYGGKACSNCAWGWREEGWLADVIISVKPPTLLVEI